MSSYSEEPGLSSYDRGTDSSQDSTSTAKIEVKEEPEDAGYEHTSGTPVPSEQNSTNDSRNSSPLPPVHFDNPSPAHTREESPLGHQSNCAGPSSQIPLTDLYAGSAIRTQLQGAIAGKKMDAVQNIVEGLLKKNETLLAMSDAGSFKPHPRRPRTVHDGFVKRYEPAYPTQGSSSVFPVSSNLKARVNASKKTSDTLKQRLIRPKSPTRRCESLLADKSHFSYALMESNASDEEIEKIFKVQNHELVCAISSKSAVTDKSNKVVAALDFNYFWCNFCPFHTNNKSLLTQHIMEHRFTCKYCAYQSFCRSDVVRHMRKVHQEFADIAKNLFHCTLLSDYLRVKARTDGKENKDPDEDVDEIDPQLMEVAAAGLGSRKRVANDENDEGDDDDCSPYSPSNKSAKIETEDTADIPQSSTYSSLKEKLSKSRKSSNPKRHPPLKDSDYDMFDMEVEEISEAQEDMTPDESDSEKAPYSSSLNSPNPHATGQEHSPYPTGMMQVIPSFQGNQMQTLTTHVSQPTSTVISGPRSPPRPGYRKKTTPSSSRLYWSCGYCSFQSNSQSQIKDHSNMEHPGKPHRYVALIKNMTPDNIIHRSPRKSNTKYPSVRHSGPLGNIPAKPQRSPQSNQSHDAPSPHVSNYSTLNGEDNDDDVSLVDKIDSPSVLKVKINPGKAAKKESIVYRCYHCTYTAKRHSSMKSHIYYKHRGKALVAVDDESESNSQIYFCARDDCTFKSESGSQYLNHVEQCTPWNKPELADVEVEPHIRECLEQTVEFAEAAKEQTVEQTMLTGFDDVAKESFAMEQDETLSTVSDTDIRIERRLSFDSDAQDAETPTASPTVESGLTCETDRTGVNEFENIEKENRDNENECLRNKSKLTENVICESPKGSESELVNLHEDLALDTDDELSSCSDNVEMTDVDKEFLSESKSKSGFSPDGKDSSDLLNLSNSSFDNFLPVGVLDNKCQRVEVIASSISEQKDSPCPRANLECGTESGIISDTEECNIGFSSLCKTASVSPQKEKTMSLYPSVTLPSPQKSTCGDIERKAHSPHLDTTPLQTGEILLVSPGLEVVTSHSPPVTFSKSHDKESDIVSNQEEMDSLSFGKDAILLSPQEETPFSSHEDTVVELPQEEIVLSSPQIEAAQQSEHMSAASSQCQIAPSSLTKETASKTPQIEVPSPCHLETVEETPLIESLVVPIRGEPGTQSYSDNNLEQIVTDSAEKYEDDFKYQQPAAYEVVESHTEFGASPCNSEHSMEMEDKGNNEKESILESTREESELASLSQSQVEDEEQPFKNKVQNSSKDENKKELALSSSGETSGTKAKELQGDLRSPTRGSSLKLKFKMFGNTTICSMSSQEIDSPVEKENNSNNEDSSSSSSSSSSSASSSSSDSSDSEAESNEKEEETDINEKKSQPLLSQDPKWLQDLIDSTGDSDSDLGSNPRSVPLSVSSVSEVCENSTDLLLTKKFSSSKEDLDGSTCPDHIQSSISAEEKREPQLHDEENYSSQEKIMSPPLKTVQQPETEIGAEKLCYAYVPARSAAMKALSKMKPSLDDEEICTQDIDSPDSFKSKKSSHKGKLPISKSYAASNPKFSSLNSTSSSSREPSSAASIKSVTHEKQVNLSATSVTKSSPTYMCPYCIDINEGSLRSIKQHVLNIHKSMPPMVINCFKQRRHKKCQFYICPHQSCYKLSCSQKEFESHRQAHTQNSKKPKIRSTSNGLQTNKICSSLKNLENMPLPKATNLTAVSFPSCRVELDMLDFKKIKSLQTVQVKPEEKKYQCLYCTEYFFKSSLADMKSHYAKEHEGQLMVMRDTEARRAQLPSRIYVCDNPNCECYYINRSDLDSHFKSHKSNFTYIYECASCGWFSSSHSAATQHVKKDHGDEGNASLVHMQVTVNEFGETSKKIL